MDDDLGLAPALQAVVEGRSRVYYTLTAKGERRYRQLADTWSSLALAIQSVLKGSRYATEL